MPLVVWTEGKDMLVIFSAGVWVCVVLEAHRQMFKMFWFGSSVEAGDTGMGVKFHICTLCGWDSLLLVLSSVAFYGAAVETLSEIYTWILNKQLLKIQIENLN